MAASEERASVLTPLALRGRGEEKGSMGRNSVSSSLSNAQVTSSNEIKQNGGYGIDTPKF